jgi:hypothetical protein
MGYDWLGSMDLDQWKLIKEFTQNSVKEIGIESNTVAGGLVVHSDSGYIKHLKAEKVKANVVLVELDKAVANFNNFVGDVPFQSEEEVAKQALSLNKNDTNSSVVMYDMKDFQKQQLKRKKENLEYRIKKMLDLDDALGVKVIISSLIADIVEENIKDINRMFNDPTYRDSLRKGVAARTTQGYSFSQPVNVEVKDANSSRAKPVLDTKTTNLAGNTSLKSGALQSSVTTIGDGQ